MESMASDRPLTTLLPQSHSENATACPAVVVAEGGSCFRRARLHRRVDWSGPRRYEASELRALRGFDGGSRPVDAVPWQRMTGVDASGQPALEPLLCIEEVAQLLRVSERSVYRLMHRGELASLKVGHRTLV